MGRGGVRGPRKAKLFIVQVGEEKHVVKALTSAHALKYAVQESVRIRPCTNHDLKWLMQYQEEGGEIYDATAPVAIASPDAA